MLSALRLRINQERYGRTLWRPFAQKRTRQPNIVDGDIPVDLYNEGPAPMTGLTDFFRFNMVYDKAIDCAEAFHQAVGRPVDLIEYGCSVGASLYSMSYLMQARGHSPEWMNIAGLDISPTFCHVAREAIYPKVMMRGIPTRVRRQMFEPYGFGYVRVRDQYRKPVSVMAPISMLDPEALKIRSDIAVSTMALMYVRRSQETTSRLFSQTANYAVIIDDPLIPHIFAENGFVSEDRQREAGFTVWRRLAPLS